MKKDYIPHTIRFPSEEFKNYIYENSLIEGISFNEEVIRLLKFALENYIPKKPDYKIHRKLNLINERRTTQRLKKASNDF